MHNIPRNKPSRLAGAALLVTLLAGCQKTPAPGEEPAPVTPQPPQAAAAAPIVEIEPVKVTMDPQPHQVAAAPVPAPAAAAEPPLASMALAAPGSKLGVPADLRYRFDGDAASGQAVTLHLAAVPRVAGSNLAVSIKQVPGIKTTVSEYRAARATATTAYRQQLSLVREANGPTELRVVVTMDMPIGSAFSYFSVPLVPVQPATKQAPVEMR
jgi:hypothetical protein